MRVLAGTCPALRRGSALQGNRLPQEYRALRSPETDEPLVGDILYIGIFVVVMEYKIVTLIVLSTCSVVVIHGGNSPRFDIWWT